MMVALVLRMNAGTIIRAASLLLLLSGSGCATHALWSNDRLESWNEPAPKANLHLFDAGGQKGLLVVYDEYSDRHGTTKTRAYWLNENQKRLEQRRTPYFVSTNSSLHLAA